VKLLRRIGYVDVTVEPFDFIHPQLPVSLLRLAERLTILLEKTPFIKEFAGSLIIQGNKK
jgi:hypothetical protein